MAFRFAPILILLAIFASSFAFAYSISSLLDVGCLQLGQCTAESGDEFLLPGEDVRRGLAGAQRHISYGALKRNSVPCGRRGNSYYNCGASGRANPYHRGCSAITRCARATA